ncbi:MAG: PucR family transcriptional regulator [Bacillota bacterium]|nr:PucR family transcriptional regulator [Bacillota bacterium]
MPLTVAEALKMEIFRNCRLLTGRAGLHNEILWVNILEILDDLSHIEPGEFLITTAHDFSSQSEGAQHGMIELFAARKLAAMAIQTGYYLKEIPSSFIYFSEEHNIPLIEIPSEVSFKNLTRALMIELLHNEQSESVPGSLTGRHLEEQVVEMMALWKRLIDAKNPADIAIELERYELNLQDAICIQTFAFQQGKDEKSDQAGKDILSSAQLAALQTLKRGNCSFLIGREEDYVAVLIQALELEKLLPASLAEISCRLAGELSLSFPGCHLKSGLSSVHSDINEFNNALDESVKALQLARLGLINGSQTVFFSKMGLYRLIMDIKNMDTLKEIYRDTIMPLVKYDCSSGGSLLSTLQVFLKHGSIKAPAAELFVHRHTMKYRLGQINKLTGLNPFNPDDALQLNMGLHIFHYLKARNLLHDGGKTKSVLNHLPS